MSTPSPVTISRKDSVVHVWLSRPDAMNVIDQTMATALADTFEQLHKDDKVRAVTLRGEGKHFMAGGDLSLFRTTPEQRLTLLNSLITDFHRAIRAIRRLPVPIIAGVHGAAAGAGFSLALACDFIIADEKARFVPAYSRIGATPDGGLTWSLAKAAGRVRANEVLMLGEPLTAQTAYALALINRIVPRENMDIVVDDIAQQLAQGSASSTRAIKALVSEAEIDSFEQHLEREHEAYRKAVVGKDFETGLDAFFAGKKPVFMSGPER